MRPETVFRKSPEWIQKWLGVQKSEGVVKWAYFQKSGVSL